MGNSLRIKTLASAIGFALIGVGFAPSAMAASTGASVAAQGQNNSRAVYIIRFAEPGLLHYTGGAQGLGATAPKAIGQRKLDVRTQAAESYKAYLASQRDAHLQAIAQAIGRPLDVTHTYLITMNGVAAELTAAEAATVANLPGVQKLGPAREYPLATYHGPEFIGAPSIWDGTAVTGGVGTRGQGIVIGDIDTGINSTHPSFADDPTCGVFGPTNHKLLSAVDCLTTNGAGECVGTNPEANDGNGHGVHTASTAAGNTLDTSAVPPPVLPAPFTTMSGVASCASLRTYKVCATNNCTGQAILAATEAAIVDQVDVINFSISGGSDPWNDSDRTFLDAVDADIFVSASAGNTSASITDPVGAVNHLGPWLASVAASTHDLNVSGSGLLTATGPGTPPANTQNISMNAGSGLDPGTPLSSVPIRHYATNEIGCTADGGFPANYFDGAVALISRGTCTFEEKINNAQAAGALVAVIYNNVSGAINMSVGAASLPAYSILQAQGQALETFMDGNDPTPTTVDFAPAVQQGDVIAGFSLRGPSSLTSVTKPDIAGPGVNIYAALDNATTGGYGYLSGTSMAAPHLTGSAALIRAVHPDWTPAEVKSALMLTAFTAGHEEDRTTPWTPDDVGAGRADLTKAALAGFVLNETFDNFLAAEPPGGDPATLNIASARDVSCSGSCNWTRVIRNAIAGPSSWTVSVNSPAGLDVTVDPPTFAFTGAGGDVVFADGFDGTGTPPGPEFQTLTITATPTSALTEITFAEIVFHEANGLAPDAHFYVSVQGSP